MKLRLLVCALLISAGCDDDGPASPSDPSVTFFVTSATNSTGNLGGLAGADATCQQLATAAGHGSRTWRAYLSVERDASNNNLPTHARNRIGDRSLVQRQPRARREQPDRASRARGRRRALSRRTRDAYQRAVDRIADAEPARHSHGIERRRHGRNRLDVFRLDLELDGRQGAGRALRRPRARSEHVGHPRVLELGARQPGLLEHRTSWRLGPLLLFRAVIRSPRALNHEAHEGHEGKPDRCEAI